MASLIVITIIVTVAGVMFGAYLKICFAIRREDRLKWSLRSRPLTLGAKAARLFVGVTGTRRD